MITVKRKHRKSRGKVLNWEPGQAERWAGYLCKKSSRAFIEVEMPFRFKEDFENDYKTLAGEEAYLLLPQASNSGSNYLIQENKRGREYRVYFNHGGEAIAHYKQFLTLPSGIETTIGRDKTDVKSRRISYINFAMRMFELGFRVGKYDLKKDFERIKSRISKESLSSFDEGFNM